jgi:urease accessory protein
MMFDVGSRSETALQPRAEGRAELVAEVRGGVTRLAHLYQRGSAKCLLPRLAGRCEAVFLNTAGGITGGDRLAWAAEAGPGAGLVVTTQAAERIYRAQPGQVGRVATRLTLGTGARLEWLPQETILFDRSALERTLTVEVAADATLLALEAVVLGRKAMGEQVGRAHFTEHWRIRRAGRLVYADALRLTGAVAETVARPALMGGHRALASLVYMAPDAEARLGEARALLGEAEGGVESGASAWNGLFAIRMLAPDGQALRRALLRFLAAFRAAPLPRVWTM